MSASNHDVYFHPPYRQEYSEVWKQAWRTLPVDGVSICEFDRSGQFCAICGHEDSVELWDMHPIPLYMHYALVPSCVPATERFCRKIAFSYTGSHLVCIFGLKSVQRKSVAVHEKWVVVWDLSNMVCEHVYR